MPKSIRIRTEPGVDKDINIKIDQDFDFLEILSLKLRQEDLYTQFCADYGVVVGRVIANGGLGIPNAHISIFIPIDEVDENNPIISTLYPYKTPEGKNEDGYRYNLLPYEDEYYGHTATGTFPTVDDVLTRKEVLQVYEKYYKYSVRSNESGDFMIVGVPLGAQKIVLDLDLSNMGEFSLRPSDLLRMGMGVPSQFDGQLFKSSENIDSLPQILHDIKDIDVSSFWGQDDVCDVGITRVDFDLRERGIEILPHATFMGSIFSSTEDDYIKASCRPKKNTGNLCDTVAGPGTVLAIRQTIYEDDNGDPVLEQYNLEEGGNVIDENGVWLIDLPMNMEYITTNEFGERVVSYDPSIGVPTKSKYRFKIKWQNEAGLQTPIMRANYLIPNIKEHWNIPPVTTGNLSSLNINKSYAFSLDWNDYADKTAAIKCEDTFYLFTYNKVYTVASHIDRFKWGYNRASHYGIKEITDRACMSENNRFPTNDGQRNFDFLYFLFNLFLTIVTPIIIVILPLVHVLALIYPVIRFLVNFIITIVNGLINAICNAVNWIPGVNLDCPTQAITPLPDENPFKNITLPMITYPDCEACPCESTGIPKGESETSNSLDDASQTTNTSNLADVTQYNAYDEMVCHGNNNLDCGKECMGNSEKKQEWFKSFSRILFSGYEGYSAFDDGFGGGSEEPRPEWIKSPFSLETTGSKLRTPVDVSLPQALNLMNQRDRYFNGVPNRIQTTIINDQFAGVPLQTPSSSWNQFEDMPLIVVMDSGVELQDGQLLSFTNPNLVDDVNVSNITGFTDSNGDPYVANQFGNIGITGDVLNNQTNYVNKQISYIKPNGSLQNVTLQLHSPNSGGTSYNFKMGMEYYQVITGVDVGTIRSLITSTSEKNNSILWQYFLNKNCRFFCRDGFDGTFFSRNAMNYYTNGNDLKVYFLTRGVDPYTPKQKIRYDLSKLFGRTSYGTPALQVEGEYFLNIPIQQVAGSVGTPATHHPSWDITYSKFQDTNNGFNPSLYHSSFLFTPDSSLYTSFNSTAPAYYSSLGSQWGGSFPGSNGSTVSTQDVTENIGGTTYTFRNISLTGNLNGYNMSQGRVDGASYQWTNRNGKDDLNGNNTNHKLYTISPSYWVGNGTPPKTIMSISNKLIMRSDRLPTSTNREVGPEIPKQDFPLHLNNRFQIYLISENGESTSTTPNQSVGSTDGSGGLDDFGADGTSALGGVLGTFTCEEMVPFSCYDGEGENFTVLTPCEDDDRVVGGCYTFVQPIYIATLIKDYKYLFEWRTRIKFMFAVCRGIVGHMFQNNWVNGTLYMPSFQKKTFYDGNNQVRRYKYCGDPNQGNAGLLFIPDKIYRGPIYFNTDSNSFYYRSAPYYNGQFIPQTTNNRFPGNNEGQIWQPTTIMDLGPKTDYLKEIILTPEFQGYIIDTIESTSYQDISGILNLFVMSRLLNAGILEQLTGLGDASIQQLFSRQDNTIGNRFFDSRVDGDYAQMIGINSEYGVLAYIDGNYFDSITLSDDRIGIWFTGDTVNRGIVGPGTLPYSNFDYIGSQTVPYYSWKTEGTTLFGTQENKWITNTVLSGKYQDHPFTGTTDYARTTLGPGYGYLYNATIGDPESDTQAPTNGTHSGRYRVGSPFYFYFGLKRGKSAMNRFIKKFIFYND